MNFQSMMDACRDRAGLTASDPQANDTALQGFVRSAIATFESEAPNGWPWARAENTWATVVDQEAYSFATIGGAQAVRKIDSLWVLPSDVSVRLELGRMQRVQQLRDYEFIVSYTPQTWSVEGSSVYLSPTPDAVYSMLTKACYSEPELSGGTSTLTFVPPEFHPVIVEKATELLLRKKHNQQEAQQAHQEYLDGVRRARQSARQYGGAGVGVTATRGDW